MRCSHCPERNQCLRVVCNGNDRRDGNGGWEVVSVTLMATCVNPECEAMGITTRLSRHAAIDVTLFT